MLQIMLSLMARQRQHRQKAVYRGGITVEVMLNRFAENVVFSAII